MAAKRGMEAAKRQTLDEASKELLALADEDDKGYSADDDDDDSLRPERLPSKPMENKRHSSASDEHQQSIQFIIWLVKQ